MPVKKYSEIPQDTNEMTNQKDCAICIQEFNLED